jgi:ADP-heptose:LPS heptosyltransferase
MNDVLRATGIQFRETELRLKINPLTEILERMGLIRKSYVFLHPRGASDRRRLSEGEAEELINFILSTNSERNVLLSGAENEREAIEDMVKSSNDPRRVFSVIGATPSELAALIEGAEIFVGMDTGITHLACFLGKKTLVIAKNATANWLPYYNKNATVVYRFKEDEKSRTDEEYMWAHQNDRIRPFGNIPMKDVFAEFQKLC